jgi:catechol 1,2-dioxygenase
LNSKASSGFEMIIGNEQDVTQDTLAVMAQTNDPRMREIMISLVRHLHGFVRDVKLTEAEFREAASLINEIGKQTSDTHNEAILMAGSLGVSSLVCLLNNGEGGNTETSQSLLGPFWRLNSPRVENGGSIIRSDTPGDILFVSGRIINKAGEPIAGAEIDVWHASPVGLYEQQDAEQAEMNLRGKFMSDDVVGRLLKAQNRHPYRPAHLHALIAKRGYKVLISQVYNKNDPHIDTDVQFGVTKALLGDFKRHDEPHPNDPQVVTPWYSLDYTYVMEKGETVLPKAPIK